MNQPFDDDYRNQVFQIHWNVKVLSVFLDLKAAKH